LLISNNNELVLFNRVYLRNCILIINLQLCLLLVDFLNLSNQHTCIRHIPLENLNHVSYNYIYDGHSYTFHSVIQVHVVNLFLQEKVFTVCLTVTKYPLLKLQSIFSLLRILLVSSNTDKTFIGLDFMSNVVGVL